MEEGFNEKDNFNDKDKAEIFSKAVRAGKRTYFFDVKATRGNDYYLTVTESKKRFLEDGKFRYEKHKLFLYKEDFEKFAEGLNEAIEKIKELQEQNPSTESAASTSSGEPATHTSESNFTNVNFEDLEDK